MCSVTCSLVTGHVLRAGLLPHAPAAGAEEGRDQAGDVMMGQLQQMGAEAAATAAAEPAVVLELGAGKGGLGSMLLQCCAPSVRRMVFVDISPFKNKVGEAHVGRAVRRLPGSLDCEACTGEFASVEGGGELGGSHTCCEPHQPPPPPSLHPSPFVSTTGSSTTSSSPTRQQ